MNNIILMKVMLLLLWTAVLHAQTFESDSVSNKERVCECASTDLSPAGQMLGHEHLKGVWKISYQYMNMQMGGSQKGTHSVNDTEVFENYMMAPTSMDMAMHMLMGMYGISNNLSVMIMTNYNVLDMDMTMNLNSHNHGVTTTSSSQLQDMESNTKGLGDTKLYATYTVYNTCNSIFFFIGGVSIPTGSIKERGNASDLMYANLRYPYMMQLGSGSVDLMPSLSYLYTISNFALSAQLNTVLHTYNNSLNYRMGDQIGMNVWSAYKWNNWLSNSIRLEAKSIQSISGKDVSLIQTNEPSAVSTNYGGKFLNAFVGANIYFNKSFLQNNRLSFEYGVPLYQNLNGIQQTRKGVAFVEWMITF